MKATEEYVQEILFAAPRIGTMKNITAIVNRIKEHTLESAANRLATKAVFAVSTELQLAYIECEREVRGMIPGVKA